MSQKTASNLAVLIPAHNEPDLGETINSVLGQTVLPCVILVVADMCTDRGETASIARNLECEVIETTDNPHKKAGALNRGYDHLRESYPEVEFIVQMDADTALELHFIERTLGVLESPENAEIAALSCAFVAKKDLGGTWPQRMCMLPQAMEYMRYQDSAISAHAGVVSGTACLLRVAALAQIQAERDHVWSVSSLVEDFELTLKLRELGWHCKKSKKFVAYTDLMRTPRSLWRQRLRWQRGTFDELRAYGWTSFTSREWTRQLLHAFFMLLHVAGTAVCLTYLVMGQVNANPLLLSCLALIALKQAYHVREMGWPAVVVALLIIPDEVYNFFRHGWWVAGLYMSLTRRSQGWA